MSYRPSFWFVSSATVLILLILALRWRDLADAPPAPPPLTPAEGVALAQAAPFNPALVVKIAPVGGRATGAAASIADGGAWLTARSIVAGCARVAIVIGAGEGIVASVGGDPAADVAVLISRGGAPALPIAPSPPPGGALAVAAGYVAGRPAEAAMSVLGPADPAPRRRSGPMGAEPLAELGRTQGLSGLSGLIGAPMLDEQGRIAGVILGEAPRRGRFYAASLPAVRTAMASAHIPPAASAAGSPITVDNYGLAADDLRRTLRIAPVVCIS